MTKTKQFLLTLLMIPFMFIAGEQAHAQSPFDIVKRVNERVITRHELDQRMRFLKLLGTAGNLEKEAMNRLIDERLYLDAAAAMGVDATEEQVTEGMIEFAARAELDADEFIQELSKENIDAQAFRDFVYSGIVWREVVGARFGARGAISDAELDRALSLTNSRGGVRVLLSEIILPADTFENLERAKAISREIVNLKGQDAFSAAASQVSVAQSAPQGGKLDWISLSDLPAPIRPVLLTLSPGEISEPIDIPNAILIFQMRGIQETAATAPPNLSVEYARLLLPGGRSPETIHEAQQLRDKADTCDDLYGLYKGASKERLEIITQASNQVPHDIATELAKLDPGEFSYNLTSPAGTSLMVLMLCGRTAGLIDDENRAAIRNNLVNQRLASYATSYLAELKASALIR